MASHFNGTNGSSGFSLLNDAGGNRPSRQQQVPDGTFKSGPFSIMMRTVTISISVPLNLAEETRILSRWIYKKTSKYRLGLHDQTTAE